MSRYPLSCRENQTRIIDLIPISPFFFRLAAFLILTLTVACSADIPDDDTAYEPISPAVCGKDATRISAIQGRDATSPLLDARVTVEAVVVGDYQQTSDSNPNRPELGGFYLQEEDTDADDDTATSEGLFVHDPAKNLELTEGSLVRVDGRVSEFAGNTQLDNVSSVVLCGTGQRVTPATIDLPIPSAFATLDSFYEPLEGMLVRFSDVMTVSDHYELPRYGQLLLSQGGALRHYSQDGDLPLTEAGYRAELNAQARRSIRLDDFTTRQNVDPVYFPQPGNFAVSNYVRIGAEIADLNGVINYTADQWMLQAIKARPPVVVNPERPVTPPPVEGNVRLAALNVLNYFNGDGQGGGFPTSRGADSQAELDRQTSKIVAAIAGLNADALGLMEIENDGDGPNDALAYLVNAVNQVMGPGTYEPVLAGGANGGSDDIKVALMYKPAVLQLLGPAQVLEDADFTDPNQTGSQQSRPALAQTFRVIAPANADLDSAFTVVVLHLKSKGSPCGGTGDDGPIQGNCNGTRRKGARALLDWLAADPTDTRTTIGRHDPDVFIIGDLNAYYQEDPLQVFFNAGYSNLLAQSEHTFVFSGRRGSLDHALVSPSLLSQRLSGAVWHINADENSLLDYDDTVQDSSEEAFEVKPASNELYAPDAYRSSDHDPILVVMEW